MDGTEHHQIERARAGDQRAFRALIDRHARPLFGVCHRILGDAAAAEDAVQDALLSAFRALAKFDGRSGFGTWLHRIAVNAAIAQLRARRAEVGLDDLHGELAPVRSAADVSAGSLGTGSGRAQVAHALVPPVTQPDAIAQGDELGRHLGAALARLTPLERTAFVLKHLEQYSLEEIAQVLESNVNACKQAIFRAVQKLRTALAPLRSEP